MPKVKDKPKRVEVVLVKRGAASTKHSSPRAYLEHTIEVSDGGLTDAAETESESEVDPNVFITAAAKKFKVEENSDQLATQNFQIIASDDSDHKPDSLFTNDFDNKSDPQSASDVSDKRLQEAWQTYNELARSHRQKLRQYKHSKRLVASLRRENRRLLREAKVHAAKLHDAKAEIAAQKIELKHKKVSKDALEAKLGETQAKLGRLQTGVALLVAQFSEV